MAERPPFLGLPFPMLDYVLALPGDYGKTLLRVAQLARAAPGVVDGIALDTGEALISYRSPRVWGRVALDAELAKDGEVALRRRALARAERDGWVQIRPAHRSGTASDTRTGTGTSTPATIVRFLRFREILWPASVQTAQPAAQPTAQEPAPGSGTITPALALPDPLPAPPEKLKLAPSADALAAPPSPVLVRLPCVGAGPQVFEVSEAQVTTWREAFPAVDVLGEVRKANAWLEANGTRRKTHRGMPAFLVRWLTRAQDHGGSRGGPSGGDERRRMGGVGTASDLAEAPWSQRRHGPQVGVGVPAPASAFFDDELDMDGLPVLDRGWLGSLPESERPRAIEQWSEVREQVAFAAYPDQRRRLLHEARLRFQAKFVLPPFDRATTAAGAP